jgi:hypothetical protein
MTDEPESPIMKDLRSMMADWDASSARDRAQEAANPVLALLRRVDEKLDRGTERRLATNDEKEQELFRQIRVIDRRIRSLAGVVTGLMAFGAAYYAAHLATERWGFSDGWAGAVAFVAWISVYIISGRESDRIGESK